MAERRPLVTGAIVIWALGALAGTVALARYETAPGRVAEAPARWPEESALSRTPGEPTVVMLAHPYCPCTRASLAEFAALLAGVERVTVHVVFFVPDGRPERWAASSLWAAAASIRGVTPVLDATGDETRRFHGATSGTVVAYDTSGRLVFSGGITGSRGHVGDNPGRRRLEAALAALEPATSPVFGCSLVDRSEAMR